MKFKKALIATATSAAMALAATSSYADLVLVGPEVYGGSGLGAMSTILTIRSPTNTSFESGSVVWNGTTSILSGDAKSISTTESFSALGITNASQLRVIFNPAEPAGDSVTLNSLVLNVFNPAGTSLFSTSYTAIPHTFDQTFTGTGSAGFAFTLDAGSTAGLQTVLDQAGSGSYRVGLSASASMATGGQETFFVGNANNLSPIPEPESYAMMLAGLGLMGFMARRRSKKQV